MPIYEYKCVECGTHLEKMQKVTDAPLTICENCGGKLEKQWSLSGFQFKGEGWYVTDYAGKKAEKSASAEKGDKTEKSEKAEKSSSAESTAATDSASNQKSDGASGSAKETTSKKD
jgi:putative FmdB family regulatory protein